MGPLNKDVPTNFVETVGTLGIEVLESRGEGRRYHPVVGYNARARVVGCRTRDLDRKRTGRDGRWVDLVGLPTQVPSRE